MWSATWTSRVSGASITTEFDRDFMHAPDWQVMARVHAQVSELGTPLQLDDGKSVEEFDSIDGLLKAILDSGRKGQTIQRYKGLGEMNPDQLWDTTMDPTVRTLLKVQVQDAMEADEIFTVLMGDQVEPRREFIETNALTVRNLDV